MNLLVFMRVHVCALGIRGGGGSPHVGHLLLGTCVHMGHLLFSQFVNFDD